MSTARPRVLVAWEHGRNFGHVARLTAVAGWLQQAGADIVWALPPGWADAEPFRSGPHRCVPTPRIVPSQTGPRGAAQSFADVLASFGFLDAAALQAAVRQWLDLFDRLAIDRVVLDYAPAAQLAALLRGLPALQITNGFDAPPAECPLFDIGMRGPMLERRNVQRLGELDRVIAAVAQALGRADGASLRELLAYPTRCYDCIAETDPYGPRADGVYVGPLGQPPATASVPWPAGAAEAPKVFVYLRAEAQVDRVLAALQRIGALAIVAWPGASELALVARERAGLQLVNRAVNLREVLPQCAAVVNYGSTTLVCQAVLAGKPQVMWPADAEKWLVARRIEQVGAGMAVTVAAVEKAILRCLAVGDWTGRVTTEAASLNGLAARLVVEWLG